MKKKTPRNTWGDGAVTADQELPESVVLTTIPLSPTQYPVEGVGNQISVRLFVVPVGTICQFIPQSEVFITDPTSRVTYPVSVSVNVMAMSPLVVGTATGYHWDHDRKG